MESNLQELTPYLMMPSFLVLIGFAVMAIMAVQGYSMKVSVNLVGAGPIGFVYGWLTSMLASIGGGLLSAAVMALAGNASPFVVMCYSMFAGVIILALMVRCNPMTAFFAYLCHLFFSTVGTGAICGAFLIVCLLGLNTNLIKEPENSGKTFQSLEANWKSDGPAVTNAFFHEEFPGATETALKPPVSEPATKQFTPPINLGGGAIQTNPFSH